MKICVVTGSRAEYGLLKNLITLISNSNQLIFQLIVTGSHLSPKFGNTYSEIQNDGLRIDREINLYLDKDDPIGIAKAASIGLVSFTEAYATLKPDLLLVLGDRYEILSAVIAAAFSRIPIAHIHGGELTEGALDESIRHSITKFSHLHFVANEEYRKRVIQLGEDPKKVFNVGGLGVDAINSTELVGRGILEGVTGIKFNKKNLLITYHPETLRSNLENEENFRQLLLALTSLEETSCIFTMPNADVGNELLFIMLQEFISKNNYAYLVRSFGQKNYLSCLNHVDAIVGNSSSGITEAPTFKIPTINIGDRQKGRLSARSIINCGADYMDIKKSIEKSYDKDFRESIANTISPYGVSGASSNIFNILKNVNLSSLINKKFFDLKDS